MTFPRKLSLTNLASLANIGAFALMVVMFLGLSVSLLSPRVTFRVIWSGQLTESHGTLITLQNSGRRAAEEVKVEVTTTGVPITGFERQSDFIGPPEMLEDWSRSPRFTMVIDSIPSGTSRTFLVETAHNAQVTMHGTYNPGKKPIESEITTDAPDRWVLLWIGLGFAVGWYKISNFLIRSIFFGYAYLNKKGHQHSTSTGAPE